LGIYSYSSLRFVRKLAGAVSDLETINQCNEEIMESMKEMEKSVQLQLEREFVQNSSLNQQIAEWKNREDQYETVIQKFRQKISELNHEVQSQKDEVLTFFSAMSLLNYQRGVK
jgi:chromosome segregation ATPase